MNGYLEDTQNSLLEYYFFMHTDLTIRMEYIRLYPNKYQ